MSGTTLARATEKAIPDVLTGAFDDGEIVVAFVGAVGVDLERVEQMTEERFKTLGYKVEHVKITKHVMPKLQTNAISEFPNEFERIKNLMDLGNTSRLDTKDNGILALGVAAEISSRRNRALPFRPRCAYLVHSLKNPAEVRKLREIYPHGFHLIGVHSAPERRQAFLTGRYGMTALEAEELMIRDMREKDGHGQQIVDTFHLSDLFVRWAGDDDQMRQSIVRYIDLLFTDPFRTPAFSEYAMYLAFAASLRSADLSRQVGAVIALNGEILATGANDCPMYGGGLYWPKFNKSDKKMEDVKGGRDWTRGVDSNRKAQLEIMEDIIANCKKPVFGDEQINKLREVLLASKISDLTEYGRVVHAEMEALLSCARKGVDTRGATIYCSTFPCHNCAKHIVAAGIDRVVFIQPYLKSRAVDSHNDTIEISYPEDSQSANTLGRVKFEPFVGVGPRRFLDLFSMDLGVGTPLERKDKDSGAVSKWPPVRPKLRIKMLPKSYIDLESEAAQVFRKYSVL